MDANFENLTFDQVMGGQKLKMDALAMRGSTLLKKGISHVHEAFADYLLMNPGTTLREMGAYFGYTVPWICSVVNTDMFKAYMRSRRNEVEVCIAQDLPQKLQGAAHLATERIMDVLEKTEDSGTIIDCFDKILHRYGFAPNKNQTIPGTVNNTQNVFYMTKDDMQEAKAALIEAHQERPPVLPGPVADGSLPTEVLQASGA